MGATYTPPDAALLQLKMLTSACLRGELSFSSLYDGFADKVMMAEPSPEVCDLFDEAMRHVPVAGSTMADVAAVTKFSHLKMRLQHALCVNALEVPLAASAADVRRSLDTYGAVRLSADQWAHEPARVREVLADTELWATLRSAVMGAGSPIFQKFVEVEAGTADADCIHGKYYVNDAEGGVRLQLDEKDIHAGMAYAQAAECMDAANDIRVAFKLDERVLEGWNAPGLAYLLNAGGSDPQDPYTAPRGQTAHPDYGYRPGLTPSHRLPVTDKMSGIVAGPEGCELLGWLGSHRAFAMYLAAKTAADRSRAIELAKELQMVHIKLNPGEMLVFHGNFVHAGCKRGPIRVHQYLSKFSGHGLDNEAFVLSNWGIDAVQDKLFADAFAYDRESQSALL